MQNANWNHHFEGNNTSEGKVVDFMEKVDQRQEDKSIKLECPECDNQFWFRAEVNGFNAVVKDDKVYAKCPQCHALWDGTNPGTYYAIAMLIPKGVFSGKSGDIRSAIIDVVKAENGVEAIKGMKWPEGFPDELKTGSISTGRCPKSMFEEHEKHKEIAVRLQEKFGNELSGLISRWHSQSPSDIVDEVMKDLLS